LVHRGFTTFWGALRYCSNFTIHHYNSWLTLFAVILVGGLPALFSLTAFIYYPSFLYNFLPELEVLSTEQENWPRKPRKQPNELSFRLLRLIVIYYVNCKISDTLLPANDSSAEVLNKLYGLDKDKLKQNLSRLYKIFFLSARERAEMLKGVENAKDFFKD
jgi:hypothetical protein